MRSLRQELTIGLLASFAGLLALGGAILYLVMRDSLYDQFDAGLRTKALVVITATRVGGDRVRVYFSDRFLREFDDDVATEFFQVFDESGKSVERSDSLGRNDLDRRFGTLAEPEYWNTALPNGEAGRAIGVRFEARAEREQTTLGAAVVVASGRRELDATVAELRNIFAGGALSLLLLTAIMVPLVLRRGLRPLHEIADRATHIDADSLQTRFPSTDQPRELNAITYRLNDLLARLEASFERERRFTADLAHELRTPLAELRSQAELTLKWPEERSAASDRAILDITLHLEGLVTRLLALGRAELAQLEHRKDAVEVAALVRAVLQPLAARIRERGLSVRADELPELTIATDPIFFRAIATNLLENAVAYAPAGSCIAIRAARTREAFQLEIANPAPDLQLGDVGHMFERMWRRDRARTGGEHLGLGLALSRSFAQLLGLKLDARMNDDGVLVMTLSGTA